jgi:hypothetical protein
MKVSVLETSCMVLLINVHSDDLTDGCGLEVTSVETSVMFIVRVAIVFFGLVTVVVPVVIASGGVMVMTTILVAL